MAITEEMRLALEDGDVTRARQLFASAFPHLPQPADQAEAEMVFHVARTDAASVSFNRRAYSHAWLMERGLPSRLPDHLRPAAQRVYPVIREGVGISVRTNNPFRKDFAQGLQNELVATVADMYANGDRDPVLVKARMAEVRRDFYRRN